MSRIDIDSFGALLKEFRIRGRLTQQQLADKVGIHRNTIGTWERGDYLPESKGLVLELARYLHLNNQEARQLLEASYTSLAPHWSVPFLRNPLFTGREEVLEALHASLRAEQVVALTQAYALHGLGGIGKTQLALEYAYRHALEYSAVCWIAAETAETVISSLVRAAEILQMPERQETDQQHIVVAVQRWLTTHSQWLLIWDNLEDLDLLSRFLPSLRQGAVLITTRSQALGSLAQGVDLAPMEQEEGRLLLLRRAKLLSPEATPGQMRHLATRQPAEYAAAGDLVSMLGGLPLALDQAGAYIEETGCGLVDYLRRYEQQRVRLLDRRGGPGAGHPQSVTTTFQLAMGQVEREQCAAADLLRVCAFLYAEAIPEELFGAGAAHLGPVLARLADDPAQFDQAVAVLRNLSLVQRQPVTHTLSLHRLVQAVIREQMREPEQTVWLKRVIKALNTVFPDFTPETWEGDAWRQGERVLSHMLTAVALLPDQGGSQELARVLHKAAEYTRACARYEEAESLYHRAIHVGEQALGSEHLEVAASLNGLGLLYWEQGKYEQAESLYQRALFTREQAEGPEHPRVAGPLNNLANLYAEQGKYEQAEPLYKRALLIRERALGPEHPRVAYPLNNLAELYAEQGKDEQAEPLYQRALVIWEQALGPEDPHVAAAQEGLAHLYAAQGKDEQAEALYQRALFTREQAEGPEHPQVAISLNGLAMLYTQQWQYERAEALFQRALSIRDNHLGQHHPETAQTLHDLALLRQQQGKPSEALSLAERALKIRSQVLGETHPKTVATRTLHNQLVQEQGHVEEDSL